MENFCFTKIIKNALVGKKLKVRTSSKNLIQEYTVLVKKSNNVTDKQFESGNRKFIMPVNRTKVIGHHDIYETFTIVDAYITGDDDGSNLELTLKNANKLILTISLIDELEAIGNDTYMISTKYY